MVQPYDGGDPTADLEERLAGRRVLVTGGSGFIGRRITSALVAAGADVVVTDLRPYPGTDVRYVGGDLRHREVREAAFEGGVDAVVHLAAITSVLRSVEQPVLTYETNVMVTQELLELARRGGTEAFLFASTNAVTGDVGDATIDESFPLRPLTPYGSTKAACEMLMSAYHGAYGLQTTAFRFANVYGPGMEAKDSMVPRLMRAANSGATIQIYGDGKQVRDFIHVDDIVQGILTAWLAGHTGPLVLGSGSSDSVLDLIDMARDVTGAAIPVEHVPAKNGEMPAVRLGIAAARGLGFQPRFDLRAGLATVWPEFSGEGVAK
ncbi:MAG: NAD-dependent epimerase/dehydratase family protein [Streptosporangiales bacterium]|nr:NAD-dependent epimerase/dehydratase family protein [Streptosporangiales bacterium]